MRPSSKFGVSHTVPLNLLLHLVNSGFLNGPICPSIAYRAFEFIVAPPYDLALPDDEVLEMIYAGYDVEQIARTMNSDINLVALKCEIFNSQGYGFYPQGYDRKFLKYRN